MTPAVDWTELFQKVGATTCPKCRSVAFVADHDRTDGRIATLAVNASARFCFECGHQAADEAHPSGLGKPESAG
jgi:hypothetical protein